MPYFSGVENGIDRKRFDEIVSSEHLDQIPDGDGYGGVRKIVFSEAEMVGYPWTIALLTRELTIDGKLQKWFEVNGTGERGSAGTGCYFEEESYALAYMVAWLRSAKATSASYAPMPPAPSKETEEVAPSPKPAVSKGQRKEITLFFGGDDVSGVHIELLFQEDGKVSLHDTCWWPVHRGASNGGTAVTELEPDYFFKHTIDDFIAFLTTRCGYAVNEFHADFTTLKNNPHICQLFETPVFKMETDKENDYGKSSFSI